MILFEKDWLDYPTAIADVATTNESWVRQAAVYKSMGVKNCYFHLALLQPVLQGVDPFDPTLSIELKTAIALECKYNFWYYAREIARIPAGGSSLRYRANRGGISLLWSFFVNIDYAAIQPRQTGKSVTVDLLDVSLLAFTLRNGQIYLFTKDVELRKKNIKRVKETLATLPSWLNPTNKEDLDNTEVVTIKARGNIMKCAVGQQQRDRANNIGRGETMAIVQTDEGPFIPNVHISLPVLLAATSAARDNAELNKEPYANIFTTTAGKKDSDEGKFMYNVVHSGMYWNEDIFDRPDRESARTMVKVNSKNNRCLINGTFSHRQLGYTDAWMERKISESGGDADTINRDRYNVWTSGTETSPLSIPLMKVINQSILDPLYISISPESYRINWYIPESEVAATLANHHHVLGVDTSNAIGIDPTTMVISDHRDMSVVGTCSVSEANLHKFALWLADFMIRNKETTLVIENKSSAQGIIDTIASKMLTIGMDPFKRIYSRVVERAKEQPKQYALISSELPCSEETYLKLKKYIGFMTNGTSRNFLYSTVLVDAAKTSGHLIKDANLVNEILSLVTKNGRVDHQPGGHDDMVIAWLLTWYFVKYSTNLQHYGINSIECLSLTVDGGAEMSNGKLEERQAAIDLNIEIVNLKDKLIAAPGVIQTRMYTKLLEHKVAQLQELNSTTLTLDSIMGEIEASRISRLNLKTAVRRFNNNKR